MGPLGGRPRKDQKYRGQAQPQCQSVPNDATLLNSERNPKKKHNLRPSEQMEVGFDADWGFMLVEIDHDQLAEITDTSRIVVPSRESPRSRETFSEDCSMPSMEKRD
jgi:hypothetical protein